MMSPLVVDIKDSASGKGDPMMKNIAGERFDLRAVGAFHLLNLIDLSNITLFDIEAYINKAGESSGKHAKFSKCATYITHLSIAGKWLNETIKVHPSQKQGILEVFANESWSDGSKFGQKTFLLGGGELNFWKNKAILKVQKVKVTISLGLHHPVISGKRTADFFPFLDLAVTGLKNFNNSSIYVGGLLGHDDHSFSTIPPHDCKVSEGAHFSRNRDSYKESGLLSRCTVE